MGSSRRMTTNAESPFSTTATDQTMSVPSEEGSMRGGGDFIQIEYQRVLEAVGIEPDESPRYWYKSKVERELGRIVRQVARDVPGTTFAEV